MVFRDGPYRRQHPRGHQHLLQPERGRRRAWSYAPDYRRPAYSDRTFENASARVTWQLSPRNKLSVLLGRPGAVPHVHRRDPRPRRAAADFARSRRRPRPAAPRHAGDVVRAPDEATCCVEAASAARTSASATSSATQTRPAISIRVVEQCASGCAANGNIPGLAYRSQDFSDAHTGSYLWRAIARPRDRHAQPEGSAISTR